jgi:hypothetical protein
VLASCSAADRSVTYVQIPYVEKCADTGLGTVTLSKSATRSATHERGIDSAAVQAAVVASVVA